MLDSAECLADLVKLAVAHGFVKRATHGCDVRLQRGRPFSSESALFGATLLYPPAGHWIADRMSGLSRFAPTKDADGFWSGTVAAGLQL